MDKQEDHIVVLDCIVGRKEVRFNLSDVRVVELTPNSNITIVLKIGDSQKIYNTKFMEVTQDDILKAKESDKALNKLRSDRDKLIPKDTDLWEADDPEGYAKYIKINEKISKRAKVMGKVLRDTEDKKRASVYERLCKIWEKGKVVTTIPQGR